MKTRLLAIAVLSTLAASAQAQGLSWSAARFYLGAEVGQSYTSMDSGGFNTLGPHQNTNDDKDHNTLYGLKGGVDLGRLRFDLGYREYERGKYTTDSFAPPVPTFFYTSKIKSKAWMLSAYYDIVQHNKWSVYGGLGLGQARTDFSTNDTVVQGSGSDTNFAWQAELGVGYALTNAFQIYGGYRYADLGSTKINLTSIGGGAPAGDFSADLKSNELFLGLKYKF